MMMAWTVNGIKTSSQKRTKTSPTCKMRSRRSDARGQQCRICFIIAGTCYFVTTSLIIIPSILSSQLEQRSGQSNTAGVHSLNGKSSNILQEIQAEQKKIEGLLARIETKLEDTGRAAPNSKTEQEQMAQKLVRIETQLAEIITPKHGVQKRIPAKERIQEGVPCQFVFFLGGGKSGSTTLASWLKHSAESLYADYSPESRFLDGGKEICVGKKKTAEYLLTNVDPSPANMNACPKDRNFILDGCPSLFQKKQFENLRNMFQDRGKFIILVRDPVDRLVSHYNDLRPPRKIPDIDEKIQKHNAADKEGLSKVGALLENALSVFESERMIVVVNEIMKLYPQEVMDEVLTFLGLPNRTIVDAPPKNALNHRDIYSWPSDVAVHNTQQRFAADAQKFMKLLGITNLPWNTLRAFPPDNSSMLAERQTTPHVAIAGYAKYLENVKDEVPSTRKM